MQARTLASTVIGSCSVIHVEVTDSIGGRDWRGWEVDCSACVFSVSGILTEQAAVDEATAHRCPTPVTDAEMMSTAEPRSSEWHAARTGGIGGSEVAAILGLSPYESRFSLWHRRMGELPVEIDDTPEMEWGRRLEPVIVAKFIEEHPDLYVTTAPGMWRNTERPWQIANPDALAHDEHGTHVVEIKIARTSDGWGDSGTDLVPIHYRVQVLWYLDTLGVDRAWLVVLIGGSDYREFEIVRDKAECALIRARVAEFWTSLERAERPDIDEHSATYEAIRELHPDIDDVDVELDRDTAATFIAARAALKAAEAEARRATSLVADAMGSARRARWDLTVIARRQARNGGAPYVVAARDLPDPTTPTTQETAA